MFDAAVIGGGISGLTAAYDLTRAGRTVCVIDERSRLGGWIHTEQVDGLTIEAGPDALLMQKGELANEPNGKADPGWFYSASREQKSMLQPENVRSNANHDREAALHHDSVPIRQQGIVKNYFLHLHESEKK